VVQDNDYPQGDAVNIGTEWQRGLTPNGVLDSVTWDSGDASKKRVVVVVDDDLEPAFTRPAHQYGRSHAMALHGLGLCLQKSGLVRAVGFFLLPDNPAFIPKAVAAVQDWVAKLGGDNRVYLLSDVYWGADPDETHAIGPRFAKEYARKAAVEIAYLSIFPANEHVPAQATTFLKPTIYEQVVLSRDGAPTLGTLPRSLLEWLGVHTEDVEGRLRGIWQKAGSWFVDDEAATVMKHSENKIKKYFHPSASPDAAANRMDYIRTVQEAFGFSFPGGWWASADSAAAIHHALKKMCGYNYCGADAGPQEYNLTIGSGYLLALLAHHATGKGIDPLTFGVPDWAGIADLTNRRLLPPQDPGDAREAALALFHLLFRLFENDGLDEDPRPLVTRVEFDRTVGGLKITFRTSTRDRYPGKQGSLAARVAGLLRERDQPTEAPPGAAAGTERPTGSPRPVLPRRGKPAGTTREAVVRFALAAVPSRGGFGCPGTIWVDGDTLYMVSPITPPKGAPRTGEAAQDAAAEDARQGGGNG
jgi:hypothetical protein